MLRAVDQASAPLAVSAVDGALSHGPEDLSVREVSLSGGDARGWDAFAEDCGGSIRSSRAYMLALRLKNLGRMRLRLFEISATRGGHEQKIAQCALAVTAGRPSLFVDALQISPEARHLWTAAMKATLEALGPGFYEYGWEMNLEPAREAQLACLPGVRLDRVTPLVVQAVEFSRWASWKAFHADIRKGARQSAQFALRDMPALQIRARRGRASVLSVLDLLRLRVGLSRRKRLEHRWTGLLASYLGWTVLCPGSSIMGTLRHKGRVLAAFFGAEFGENTYYFDGASSAHNRGASWRLLLAMMERAFERRPHGKFVMGYVDYALHDEQIGGGLLRSRTACRVTNFPTSVVTFEFQPQAPEALARLAA